MEEDCIKKVNLEGRVSMCLLVLISCSMSAIMTGKAACSDDMKEACDIVELSWLLRKALRLLDTLEVTSGLHAASFDVPSFQENSCQH